MINNLLALQVNEKTQKVLLVLAAIFVIVLLIFGGIYVLVARTIKNEEMKLDLYMANLLKYEIVKNPKQFKKAARYYEFRSLYNHSKWAFRIAMLTIASAIVVTLFIFNKDFHNLFTLFFKLFPKLKWTTVGELNEILRSQGLDKEAIQIVNFDFLPVSIIPAVKFDLPDFTNPMLYISTSFYVLLIVSFFALIKSILGYIARKRRSRKMATKVFTTNLENINLDQLINSANNK